MRRAVSGSKHNGISTYVCDKLVGNTRCSRWSLSGMSRLSKK